MQRCKTLVSLGAIISLSACIGSGDDTWTAEKWGALESRAAAALTPTEDPSGIATMTGATAFTVESPILDGDTAVVGNMDVTADFDQSEITGAAKDLAFYTLEGDAIGELTTPLSGQLDLDGTITGTDFTGDLDGTLSGSYIFDGVDVTVDLAGAVDTNVSGEFLSDDNGLLAKADVSGDVEFTGTGTVLGITSDLEDLFDSEDLTGSISGGFVVTE